MNDESSLMSLAWAEQFFEEPRAFIPPMTEKFRVERGGDIDATIQYVVLMFDLFATIEQEVSGVRGGPCLGHLRRIKLLSREGAHHQ